MIMYIQKFYVHARPVSPGIVQQILPNSCTYGSLDACIILYLTATKFEHFIYSMLGFAFACILNIHIIMILNDFCLFPAYFGFSPSPSLQLQPLSVDSPFPIQGILCSGDRLHTISNGGGLFTIGTDMPEFLRGVTLR
jgi:hypothetical protein